MILGLRTALCRFLLVPMFWMPTTGFADPQAAAALLARFQQTTPLEFRYEETRRMELLTEPWKGSGYLFSTPDGTLVKLQIAPERLIMAIVGDSMYYYDSSSQRRQSAPLSYAGPMADQIMMFRAIIQGRSAELAPGYDIRAEARDAGWALTLNGKAQATGVTPARMEITGEENGRRRHIRIQQADGDETEYVMQQNREGSILELPIRQLIAEATGR